MKEVADVLNLTPRTVAFHKYRMMEQLRVKSTADGIGAPPAEGELKGTAADSTVTFKGKSCKA